MRTYVGRKVQLAMLMVGLTGTNGSLWAQSNPRAITVDITCHLIGVYGDPNDTPSPAKGDDKICEKVKSGWFNGHVEWWSAGRLLYTENGPFLAEEGLNSNGLGNQVDKDQKSVPIRLFLDGNDDPAQFATMYNNPGTTVLTAPDLRVKVYVAGEAHGNGGGDHGEANGNGGGDHDAYQAPTYYLVTDQYYKPVASALWAKHSEDSVGLQAGIEAGDAATLAAAKAYTDQQVAAEAAARSQGDQQQKAYTDSQIATVRAEATADEAQDTQEMAAEAAARQQGDAQQKAYTDQQVAAEAAARKQGDADTLTSADMYTDQQVAAEAAARQAGDQQQKNYTDQQVAAEAAARQAGDQQQKNYTDQQVAAEAAARQMGDLQQQNYTDQQVASEAAARKQGDADTLASANQYTDAQIAAEAAARQAGDQQQQNYTDQQVAAEAAARKQGDANTLTAANQYTDMQVAAEAAARQAGDQQQKAYTDQQVAAEAAARQSADMQTLTSANQYTDQQVAAEAAARKQGDTDTLASANAYTDAQVTALHNHIHSEENALDGNGLYHTTNPDGSAVLHVGATPGGGLQVNADDVQIANNGVTSAMIQDGTIANVDVAGNTQYVSVQDGAGAEQFSVSNGNRAFEFADSASVMVSFDPANHRLSFSAQGAIDAGNAATLAAANAYTDAQVTTERTRAMGAETTLQSSIAAEAVARQQGDAATLAASEAYTNAAVSNEAAQRQAGDAATLTSSMTYTDAQVTVERNRAMTAETTLQSSIAAEAVARQQGDAATLATSEAYTNAAVSNEAAQRQAGDTATLTTSEAYGDANFVHRNNSIAETVTGVKTFTDQIQGSITNADTSVNFSGTLAGDVMGPQKATVISNGAVTNAKIAANTTFVSVQNGGGNEQWQLTNSNDGLKFANSSSVSANFDIPSRSVYFTIPFGGVQNNQIANASVNVNTGAGLTGGGNVPLGGSITLSIPAGGVSNSMLANSSVTVAAGTGLSGGGPVSLGGMVTLNNTGVLSVTASAPLTSSGGQNPNISLTGIVPTANGGTGLNGTAANGQLLIGTGAGYALNTLTAGPGIQVSNGPGSITLSIPNGGVTNPMLQNSSVTVTAGSGLAGGGTVALGGTIALAIPANGITPSMVSSGTYGINISGNAATATNATNAVTAVNFTGALAGDVTGTQSNTTVGKINNTQLGVLSTALSGQVLAWNGTQWVPQTISTIAAGNFIQNQNVAPQTPGTFWIANSGRTSSFFQADGGYSITSDPQPLRTSWNNQDPNSVNPMPRSCPVGQIAVSTGAYKWACSLNCAFGTADCNGSANDGCETKTSTDPANCGTCGTACSSNNIATPTCSQFICSGTCNTGFSDCNSNKQTDGCETSTYTDPNNCGTCSTVCSNNNMSTRTCGTGVCNGTCQNGFGDCNGNKQADGCETSTFNVNNCGPGGATNNGQGGAAGCGCACSTQNGTPGCGAGSCTITCNPGFANCDAIVGNTCSGTAGNGCEVSLLTDPANCGSCNGACSTNNITRACAAGSCETGACNTGFADCNANKRADGCEINTTNNVASCGSCGAACPTPPNQTTSCSASSCTAGTCSSGFYNVDGPETCTGNVCNPSYLDGCECAAPLVASNGTCSTPINLGNVAPGGSVTQVGTIPGCQGSVFYLVTFSATGCANPSAYHPNITLQTPPPGISITVWNSGCGSQLGCLDGGSATNKTQFETYFANAGTGCPGGANFAGFNGYSNVLPAGNAAIIEVKNNGTTCNTCSGFSLVVQNGP